MRENGHEWVGQYEAALFITEFANELHHGGGKNSDETLGTELSFAEFQRCFMPCEAPELRATLSQRPCSTKQAYLPLQVEELIATLIGKEIEFLQVAQ